MTNNETVWTDWLENPSTGGCPVPEWAESLEIMFRSGVQSFVHHDFPWDWTWFSGNHCITHYRYVVPADLAWLAEHVTRWGGGDRNYVWVQKPGGKAWWHEMYSDGESSVITQYSKDDWLRARRDMGYIAPAERSAEFRRKCAGETVPEPDPVNHPDHYQSDSGIECIDAIRAALGRDGFIAYCRGNAIKYAWRAGRKAKATEDKRKAAWYLERAAREDDG